MPDTFSPETRSRVMRTVRARDTAPELRLRKALHARGVRGWRCHRKLPGSPDLSFGRVRLAVFVDGAFWHGHPSKYWPGRTSEYWDRKIAGNMARDKRVNRELADLGWVVLRLWDFEIEGDPGAAAARVESVLSELTEAGQPQVGGAQSEAPG